MLGFCRFLFFFTDRLRDDDRRTPGTTATRTEN